VVVGRRKLPVALLLALQQKRRRDAIEQRRPEAVVQAPEFAKAEG
jgi:hypothetical protein